MPSQTVSKKARTAAATKSVRSAPAPSESDFASTSALTRLLQILDLFSLERPTIRVEEVIETFSIVQSTAYRYLRELCDAGLLAQQGKGVYSLGRRIVELERLLLLSDPLLLAGKPVMDSLAARYDNRAFLLCAYYKDGALCVYKVGPDEIRYGGTSMKIQRGRGTLLPLFSGAGSHVILAHLPAHQIKSLYLTSARQISKARLGDSWHDFRDHLSGIRKRSFAETFGKLNPGMHSVAVPVIREDKRVVGSLLMLGPASKPQIAAALELVPLLQKKAAEIGRAIPAVETIGGE